MAQGAGGGGALKVDERQIQAFLANVGAVCILFGIASLMAFGLGLLFELIGG